MNDTEKYRRYPNVYRVAQELARCKHPDKILAVLAAQDARETFPEYFVEKSDQEIINEIAEVVKKGADT